MNLKVAITGPRELDLSGAGQGEVSLTVSNQSGSPLKLQAEAIPIEPPKGIEPWLEISHAERFWEFADKGTHNVTVKVKAPANAVDGKARFRLVLADQGNPDEVGAEGPEIVVLVGDRVAVPPPRRFPWWIVAVAAGVIIVGVVAWIVWPKPVQVPDVVGKPMGEAMSLLEAAGLKGVPGDAVPAPAGSSMATGSVALQDPEAGAEVEKGSEIALLPKAESPKMPSVIGLKLSAALDKMQGYRTPQIQQRANSNSAEGTVLDQDPKAGQEVSSETEMTLVVAGPPNKRVVSDYLTAEQWKKYSSRVRDHRTGKVPDPKRVQVRDHRTGGTPAPPR